MDFTSDGWKPCICIDTCMYMYRGGYACIYIYTYMHVHVYIQKQPVIWPLVGDAAVCAATCVDASKSSWQKGHDREQATAESFAARVLVLGASMSCIRCWCVAV